MTKASVIVNADVTLGKIDRNIYGQFAEHLGRCIYEGMWVGEDSETPNIDGIRKDVLQALKNLSIPVLRWPGGCFADEYHWKDGVGPREGRARMVNTHWGGVVENNHFGTHEFFRLCELLETEPYICGNVGSGSVQEMSEWVEYMTFDGESPMAKWRQENGQDKPWKLKYFGVGNENWGCGGNMRAEYYADEYRRYQTYSRNYGDNKLFKIAGGPNVDDYHWTEVLMREAGRHMDELITRHTTIMDKYDPEKRVALIVDEWGTWFLSEPGTNPGFLYQQNSLRDALVAGLHLHIFHNHHERVKMTNIAQMVNVLQAMILTEGDKMLLTPTYHVFEMFKVHQDADVLQMAVETPDYELNGDSIPQVSVSASRKNGAVHISLCNVSPTAGSSLTLDLRGIGAEGAVSGRVLTAGRMDAHNTFEQPDTIAPQPFENFKREGSSLNVELPPMSVTVLTIQA